MHVFLPLELIVLFGRLIWNAISSTALGTVLGWTQESPRTSGATIAFLRVRTVRLNRKRTAVSLAHSANRSAPRKN
ncbi:hypothetical protein C8R45DRAFT_986882 [Mycena sanguinolenta]|nr:hypothetical protein C8R45DRAFT_986882 [Mycena sanguinolenta]